jgi:hypothetical protein
LILFQRSIESLLFDQLLRSLEGFFTIECHGKFASKRTVAEFSADARNIARRRAAVASGMGVSHETRHIRMIIANWTFGAPRLAFVSLSAFFVATLINRPRQARRKAHRQ